MILLDSNPTGFYFCGRINPYQQQHLGWLEALPGALIGTLWARSSHPEVKLHTVHQKRLIQENVGSLLYYA